MINFIRRFAGKIVASGEFNINYVDEYDKHNKSSGIVYFYNSFLGRSYKIYKEPDISSISLDIACTKWVKIGKLPSWAKLIDIH